MKDMNWINGHNCQFEQKKEGTGVPLHKTKLQTRQSFNDIMNNYHFHPCLLLSLQFFFSPHLQLKQSFFTIFGYFAGSVD